MPFSLLKAFSLQNILENVKQSRKKKHACLCDNVANLQATGINTSSPNSSQAIRRLHFRDKTTDSAPSQVQAPVDFDTPGEDTSQNLEKSRKATKNAFKVSATNQLQRL